MPKLTSLESQILFKMFPSLRRDGYCDTKTLGFAGWPPFQEAITGLLRKRLLIASTECRVLLSDRGLAYMVRAIKALDDPHEEDEMPDWDYKRDLMKLIGCHHYTVDGAYDEMRAWTFHA